MDIIIHILLTLSGANLILGITPTILLSTRDGGNGLTQVVKRSVEEDFDEHVRQWVENRSRNLNHKVLWWDLYGNNQHLIENPHYHRFKVNVRMGNIQYGNITQQTEKPQQVYSKWYCNNQKNQPITTQISKEIHRSGKFSWSVERGLRIGAEVKISASIPSVLDISAGVSTEVNLRSGQQSSKEESDTFRIQYNLTIDPQTAVKADWVITEREVEIPFTAEVFISGYLAVWFEKKYDGHWLWFYPMSWLSGDEFKRHGDAELSYTTNGVFRGVRGIDSVIQTLEFPVEEGDCLRTGQSTKRAFLHLPLKMNLPIPGDE